MNNLYRGPSIYVSWGVSVHFFRNGLIRKKDLPAATMFANGSGRNEILFRLDSLKKHARHMQFFFLNA
jgi:hypothetical protein